MKYPSFKVCCGDLKKILVRHLVQCLTYSIYSILQSISFYNLLSFFQSAFITHHYNILYLFSTLQFIKCCHLYIMCLNLINLVEVDNTHFQMSKLGIREYGRVSEDSSDDSFPHCTHMQHAAPPIRIWNLFPLPLNLVWSCDLL